jgi:hypothetical protein
LECRKLAHRRGDNLSRALMGDVRLLANLFQGVVSANVDAGA